jgi:hypothetical protein
LLDDERATSPSEYNHIHRVSRKGSTHCGGTGVTRTAYELTRCPVCDGAETNEIASPDDVTREVEQLWEFHTRRLRGGTPPEHLTDRVAFSQRPPRRGVQCKACGRVYRNPRERAVELADTYAGDAPVPNVLRALHDTQRDAYAGPAARL